MGPRWIALAVAVLLLLTNGLTYADPSLPLPRAPIRGDQDGSETPLVFNAGGFDLLSNVQTFRVSGEGSQSVLFDFVLRAAGYNNEFGYFRVDDTAGRVGNLLPGDQAYLSTALQRAVVVFSSGASAFTPDFTTTLISGDILVFFLVQNSSLEQLRLSNPQNRLDHSPLAFFSLDQLNPDGVDHFIGFRDRTTQLTQFGFEDLTGGGDQDYDDILYNVATTLQPSPTVVRRDVVFIRGFTSDGMCDGANEWMREYLDEHQGRGLYRNLQIGQYLNFNYEGGGSYTCPRVDGTPAYTAISTCDGVAQAAVELKRLIDTASSPTVSIIAHSMGGLVAAYMVAANETWAKQHIASVITFDSTLKGVNGTAATARALLVGCTINDLSVRDLPEGSPAVQTAAKAATIVPFYPLDAVALPDDALFPRSHVRLDGSFPFDVTRWCGYNAIEPNCTPPTPIKDSHTGVWAQRESQPYTDGPQPYTIDKAPLVACAVAVAYSCTTIEPGKSNASELSSLSNESLQITIPSLVGRAQFVASFATPVQMRLTAPDGTVYGPSGAGRIAAYSVDATSEVYQVTDPLSGTWTIDLLGTDEAIAGTEVAFSIIELVSPSEPIAPIAVASGPYFQPVGAQVIFDAIGSYDPDGRIVTYDWDFDGNGVFDAQSRNPKIAHTYPGVFIGTAVVRVTDDDGRIATDSIEVQVSHMALLPLIRR